MEREVTGPVHAPPKIKSHCQDQNHDFSVLDQCEFDQSEQGVEDPSCIQGKLCANFPFWRDVVRASEFVLDIIQNGYKIIFWESPLPFSIENRSSALHQRSFVQGAELLIRGCMREAPIYPQFSTHITRRSAVLQHRARQVGEVLSIGPGFFLSFCCNEHGAVFSSYGCSLVLPQVLFFVSCFWPYAPMYLLLWRDSINVRPLVSTQ